MSKENYTEEIRPHDSAYKHVSGYAKQELTKLFRKRFKSYWRHESKQRIQNRDSKKFVDEMFCRNKFQ